MVEQPCLSTSQFNLRKPTLDDLDSLFLMRSDPNNNLYVERKEDASKTETNKFLTMIQEGIKERKWYYWVIENKLSKQFLGTISLWNFKEEEKLADIGYELLTAHRGKGIISEVMPYILEFAKKTLLLSSVQAEVHKDNMASKIHILRNDFQKLAIDGNYEIFELKF